MPVLVVALAFVDGGQRGRVGRCCGGPDVAVRPHLLLHRAAVGHGRSTAAVVLSQSCLLVMQRVIPCNGTRASAVCHLAACAES
jgi:hypothetical protein